MKFTLDWLKDHLDTTASANEVAEALTTVGLEVEALEEAGTALRPFLVAEVISAERHPNADKLRVCKVDAGTGTVLDVVCGAPNARAGMKSVFAPAGTFIPGKAITITRGNIRGQVSEGMLCSAAELELSEDHEGIIELPADAPVGMRYPDYAGLGGAVFDVAITPNRGDCTGVYGIARDLAAFGLGTLVPDTVEPVPSPGGASPIAVDLRFGPGEPEACRMFAGRLIADVRNTSSPEWMQKRLRAVGLRPISALVDITNFVALDRGRPLHVFDADRLTGTVHARMARAGETLLALDGKTYTLDPTIPVIADDSGPLGIAGIMGGEASSATDATRNVFVECAWFEPAVIAAAGRKLGINSDARYRFERIVDPQSVVPGIHLAARLVTELCGGRVHEPVLAGAVDGAGTVIDFPIAEVGRLTGLQLSSERIAAILGRLHFGVEGTGDRLGVSVPSFRPDVTLKADLVEEVLRMVGVDSVPRDPLPRLAHVAPRMLTTLQNRRRIARRALAARGLVEAVTWSFIPEGEARRFGGGDPSLHLANAIASDMTDMRPSLLPGLLSAVRRNRNRGIEDLALFEVGQVFFSDEPEGQRSYASAIRAGTAGSERSGRHWQGNAGPVGVFDAKADLCAALDALGLDPDKVQFVAEPAPWSHPGRGGRVQLGPKLVLGWFGELHPAWAAEFDLGGPLAAFELDLEALPEPRRRPTRTKPALVLPDLMALTRDFAFVVDAEIEAASILRAARGADKALITGVDVFDVFRGAHLEAGKKSVAIAVRLQPRGKTLTEDEIEAISSRIVGAVEKATGGSLRR